MSLSQPTSRRLLYGLSGLIAIYGLYIASPADWKDDAMTQLVFSGIPAMSVIVLVAGLVIHSKNPRRGLPLIIAGAIGPAVWFWVLPFYGPVMIAVIALAVSVTPRKNAELAPA